MVNIPDKIAHRGIMLPSRSTTLFLFVLLGGISWWAGGDQLIKRLYRNIRECPAEKMLLEKINKDYVQHSKELVKTLQMVDKGVFIDKYFDAHNKLLGDTGLLIQGFTLYKKVRESQSLTAESDFAALVVEIDKTHQEALQAVSSYHLVYGRFPHQDHWQIHQERYGNFYVLKEEYFRRKNNELPAGKKKIAPLEMLSTSDPMIPMQSSEKESQLVEKFISDVNKVHYSSGVDIREVIMALIAEKKYASNADPSDISNGVLKKDFVKGLGKFLQDNTNDCDDFAMALNQGSKIFGKEAIIVDFDPYLDGGSGHWVNAIKVSEYPYTINDEAIMFDFDNNKRVLVEPQRLVKKVVFEHGEGNLVMQSIQHNLFTKNNFKDLYLSPYIAIIDDNGRHQIDLCYCLGDPGKN